MSVEYPDDIEAVIYDLDGTLLRLAVDWDAVLTDVRQVYRAADVPIADDETVWDLMDRASECGLESEVGSTIESHERTGARESTRLPLAEDLSAVSLPTGVCSLNSEAACHIALEMHGLDPHVDVVVGRDTVDNWKPNPEPLLTVVEELGAAPEETLFVGDSASDEETANRAGTRFTYVSDGPDYVR